MAWNILTAVLRIGRQRVEERGRELTGRLKASVSLLSPLHLSSLSSVFSQSLDKSSRTKQLLSKEVVVVVWMELHCRNECQRKGRQGWRGEMSSLGEEIPILSPAI